MAKSFKPSDIYQNVTDSILADMENGAVIWEQPWAMSLPLNMRTRKAYRGINIPLLMKACSYNGWSVPAFATFPQIVDMGGMVKAGSKATYVYHMQTTMVKAKTEDELARADEDGKIKIFFQKRYAVFNFEQVVFPEGKGPRIEDLKVESNLPEDMGEIVATLGVDLRTGGNEALYSPSHDFVGMPRVDAFDSLEAYKAVLLHEITHWTGHESRMDRKIGNAFGTKEYAFEELVAELGAAYLCAELGLPASLRHAGYIQNWIKLLKDDNRAFFRAASEAQKAVDWIREKVAAVPANENEIIEDMREAA